MTKDWSPGIRHNYIYSSQLLAAQDEVGANDCNVDPTLYGRGDCTGELAGAARFGVLFTPPSIICPHNRQHQMSHLTEKE
jgi:hypothetical protein